MEIFMMLREDKDLAFALLHHLSTHFFKADVEIKTRDENAKHQPARTRSNSGGVKL